MHFLTGESHALYVITIGKDKVAQETLSSSFNLFIVYKTMTQ